MIPVLAGLVTFVLLQVVVLNAQCYELRKRVDKIERRS